MPAGEGSPELTILNLGIKIPKMGTKPNPKGLADALFSRTQLALLGLLFGQSDRSFYATEIIGRLAAGRGSVQRELQRLEESGLVTVTRIGNQKHFQANPASPLFHELCSIAQKTVGLAGPIHAAIESLVHQIDVAFVYGSVAKKTDTASSDIDLLILSDTLTYGDLFSAFEPVSQELGRAVNPTILSRSEWRKRLDEGQSFATRVMEQPKVWIVGSASDLAT